jgi:hypothetical protein
MPLIHLIYVSTSTNEMSDGELDEILATAVRNNKPRNITGMLLYAGGNFMQVLEGEESKVDEVFSRIATDPRHAGIMVISKELVAKRDFSDWSMGFRRLIEEDAKLHPGWAPYFSQGFDAHAMESEPGVALTMLKLFAQSEDR